MPSFSDTRTPTMQDPSMFSQLTHGCTFINNFVASRPAARINSASPPGWNGKYGVMLYTLPCQLVHAGFPFLPVIDCSIRGVTRWKVLTPLRLELLVKAAQSIGEWPGARRTLPRAFGTVDTLLGASPPLTRCCELAGGPLLGRGPLDGTRTDAADLAGGADDGRGGGGIDPDVRLEVEAGSALGDRGMSEAR